MRNVVHTTILNARSVIHYFMLNADIWMVLLNTYMKIISLGLITAELYTMVYVRIARSRQI